MATAVFDLQTLFDPTAMNAASTAFMRGVLEDRGIKTGQQHFPVGRNIGLVVAGLCKIHKQPAPEGSEILKLQRLHEQALLQVCEAGITATGGVGDLLLNMRDKGWALEVMSCQPYSVIGTVLRRLELTGFFGDLVYSFQEPSDAKAEEQGEQPIPIHFEQYAAEFTGVQPREVVAAERWPWRAENARRAGVRVICCLETWPEADRDMIRQHFSARASGCPMVYSWAEFAQKITL